MTAPPGTNGTVTAPRRSDFASGAAVRLALPGSDRWVLVREELTFGQQRRLETAGLTGYDSTAAAGERLKYDVAAFDIEKLVTWVLDWSFTDGDGAHIAVSRDRIEALHPDTAAEINTALDAHIAAHAGKKAPGASGTPKPAATSSSAKPSAGVGAS
jgi:hypothetical protein